MKPLLLLAVVVCADAQDWRAAMEASIARQAASVEAQRVALGDSPQPVSVEKQRESVRKQVETALPGAAPAAAVAPETASLDLDCGVIPPALAVPVVERTAQREGLAPALLQAVIAKESAWRPCAVSRKGAMGLMQLMPETASQLGVEDPFDPAQNVGAGARFLRSLLGRYNGDVSLALAAYNAGPGRVDAAGGIPRIPETQDYVSTILSRLKPAEPTATQ